jgi:S-methylmethionine-dependent homocysteine/selenocysteine methylase
MMPNPTAVKDRQFLGAQLARGQLLVMRAFDESIQDERSDDAMRLRAEFVKVLRDATPEQRKTVQAGLEACVAALEQRYRERSGDGALRARAIETTLHSLLLQAGALASQLDMLAAEDACAQSRARACAA